MPFWSIFLLPEDLKESKERLSSENDGLSKTIARKERLQEEAVVRATLAESSLTTLQSAVSTHKARLKEAEDAAQLAEEARVKAESEYQALRLGMKSMADGWRAELEWLRTDLAKVEAKHQRDLDESKLKHATRASLPSLHGGRRRRRGVFAGGGGALTPPRSFHKVTKLFKAKETAHIDVQATVGKIQAALKQTERSVQGLNEQFAGRALASQQDEELLRRCQGLEQEFTRLRRLMREHA